VEETAFKPPCHWHMCLFRLYEYGKLHENNKTGLKALRNFVANTGYEAERMMPRDRGQRVMYSTT
jgi:hypothetical protein